MSPNDRDSRDHGPASHESTETPGRGALGPRLPRLHPPAGLEERVVASLAARGLLETPAAPNAQRRGWRAIGMLATAAALFLAGGLAERARAGASSGGPPEDEPPRFALLLYGGPAGSSADEEAALVAEYADWARDLAARGRFVTGEKLGAQSTELTAGALAGAVTDSGSGASDAGENPGPIVGFFIIGARSAEEAEAIAGTIPHLRHGGRVVMRPIDPT